MTEDSPRRASGPKGQLRARLEETFLAAHTQGPGRCRDRPRLGLLWPPRQLSRRPCWRSSRPCGGRLPPGSVRWMRLTRSPICRTWPGAWLPSGRNARAWGEVWHIPSGPPVTGRAFIAEVFEALGQPPRMRRLGRGMMMLAGLFNRSDPRGP